MTYVTQCLAQLLAQDSLPNPPALLRPRGMRSRLLHGALLTPGRAGRVKATDIEIRRRGRR